LRWCDQTIDPPSHSQLSFVLLKPQSQQSVLQSSNSNFIQSLSSTLHSLAIQAKQPSIDTMADTSAPLSKVDSAVEAGDAADRKPTHRRASSSAAGVRNMTDLQEEGADIKIAPETLALNWKLNTSPSTVDDPSVLKKHLTTPPIKKIDLHFPLGLEVTARNLKGVTIKDALDAIHKQFKKKADDELDAPYLKGFEWDREECYTRFIVHQKKEGAPPSSKKAKKKGADGE